MKYLDCKKCGGIFEETEFQKNIRYKRGFASWCKDCHRKANKEWYSKNNEKQNLKSTLWAQNNKGEMKKIWRRHHQKNTERRGLEFSLWSKQNRGKRNAVNAKRRAAKRKATPKWANQEKIKLIYEKAKQVEIETGVKMHVDHIVPIQGESVCGLHCEDNLRIVPASVNISKKNKWNVRIEEAQRQQRLFA